jgi:hypothetical protein
LRLAPPFPDGLYDSERLFVRVARLHVTQQFAEPIGFRFGLRLFVFAWR